MSASTDEISAAPKKRGGIPQLIPHLPFGVQILLGPS
jgi:hypothetical protein